MKRIIFSVVLIVFIFVSMNALAEDIANVQPYKPYSWTGFYFGFQGSYDNGQSEWEVKYNGNRIKHDINGGMGGFFLGYNYQTPANVVVGFETDAGFGNISGSSSCPNTDYSCHTNVGWVGSTRFRLGYALDRFLPFITIGWAYAGADTYVKYLPTNEEFGSENSYFGWTPGIGFEVAITKNLMVRAEYSYYDFFTNQVIIQRTLTDVHITAQAFKVGLSLKF